jgi:hypothetical protein
MADLGYKSTLAPYTNKSFWTSLATSVNNTKNGTVDRIYIQCYDGGAGNNPSDWHIDNIPLHAGRLNYQDFNETKSVMQTWKDDKNVVGGFFWVYNDETWNLSKYAIASNEIFSSLLETSTVDVVAAMCEDMDYGGYNINFGLGEYTTLDMINYGLANNDVSSLKVRSGYKVTLYSDDNFTGESMIFTSSSNWIGEDFNDKASSMKIESVMSALSSVNTNTDVEIYPNPASEYLMIKSHYEEKDLTMYNLSGAVVQQFNLISGENLIDLANLPTGMYFIKGKHINHKCIVVK